ncbi:hypothetical protein MMC21_001548 [Puttea exsequens]|nr:hypothetical protein [Puttea exsequens]
MPDAWDDDWISKGDSSSTAPEPTRNTTKLSKAERRAKQAEFNRQIWEDAEDPQDNFFLRTHNVVPLKEEFKPAVKVLSRKPVPKPADPAAGIGGLSIEDDDESEDESKKNALTPLQRQEKAQREREEKQRKYEQVRSKLFGTEENTSTNATTIKSNGNRSPRNQSRNTRGNGSRPPSSASNKIQTRQLYDPNDTRPGATGVLKKEVRPEMNEIQPIRAPRNPDGSGRGGFGFAPRGGQGTL